MCNTFKQPPEASSQIYVPAVKTPVGAVAKNTENCFHGGNVAYLWSRCFMSKKGVAPLRELGRGGRWWGSRNHRNHEVFLLFYAVTHWGWYHFKVHAFYQYCAKYCENPKINSVQFTVNVAKYSFFWFSLHRSVSRSETLQLCHLTRMGRKGRVGL